MLVSDKQEQVLIGALWQTSTQHAHQGGQVGQCISYEMFIRYHEGTCDSLVNISG